MVAGAMGFNDHYANVVAAFYIDTGQDDPYLSEGTDGAEVRPTDRESLPWR